MNTKKIIICLISALAFGVQISLAAGLPNNVSGVDATPIDSQSIGLTWDSTTDAGGALLDHFRVYYGKTSIFEAQAGEYDAEIETPDNTTSYVVEGLDAGTTYFFSVTGVSTDGMESEEYSLEATADTLAAEPMSGEDTAAPTVTDVSAPDKMHVKVVFSEKVQLPALIPEVSFNIVEQINPANTLTVIGAVMDPTDETGATVLLETSEQTAEVAYIATAGVAIKDMAGNPIVSGSTDSGLFTGSSAEPLAESETEEEAVEEEVVAEEEAVEEEVVAEEEVAEEVTEEEAAPEVEAVACEDFDCLLKNLASGTPATATEADDTYEYEVTVAPGASPAEVKVTYNAKKHPSILYAGTEMECVFAKKQYTHETFQGSMDLEKCSGELVAGFKAVAIPDTTPPEDITGLMLTFRETLEPFEKFAVTMRWTASLNTAKDLVDQILYQSMDRGRTFDTGKSLGASAVSHEVEDLDGGKEYHFKITTKDAVGNESVGVIKSIRLPSTGAGVGLALLLSALGAKKVLARKEEEL
jgi:hypothetical protein